MQLYQGSDIILLHLLLYEGFGRKVCELEVENCFHVHNFHTKMTG